MSKELYEIPSDWHWSTMGEIADVVGGGTPKTKEPENFENGSIPWLTPADMSGYKSKYVSRGRRMITERGLATSSAKLMPAGTVLFSSRAPVGYVAIASNEISTNQGFKSFILKGDELLPDYVYWWLKGNKALAESLASGTTFLELSGRSARQLPIPIAPKEQQRRIVADIEKQFSRLDEAVASLKRVKANLKRYKAAILKAAVEGKLTEEWRKQNPDVEPASKLLERILAERRTKWEEAELTKMKAKGKEPKNLKWKEKYKDPSPQNNDGSDDVPEGWVFEVLEVIAGVTDPNPSHRNPKYVEEGFHFLSTAQFDDPDTWNLETAKTVAEGTVAEQEERCGFQEKSIVFSRKGTIGKTRFIPKGIRFALLDSVCVVNANNQISSEYLNYQLRGSLIQRQISRQTRGVALKQVSVGAVRGLVVPIPSFNEQLQIVGVLDAVMSRLYKLESDVIDRIVTCGHMRQSILAKAFIGRLSEQEVGE